MRKGIIATIMVGAATISLSALAGSYTTNWSFITQVESYGDDFHVVGLDLAPNPGGCSNTTVAKVDYRQTSAQKEKLSRALSSAFLAGRQVRVKLQSDYCEGNNPAIYGVYVR